MSSVFNLRTRKKQENKHKRRRVKLIKARGQCNEIINKDKIALMMKSWFYKSNKTEQTSFFSEISFF